MAVLLSSALRGSEVPRLWTRPLRELTPETSRGFEAAKFAEDILGIKLLPWQRWLLIHLLELNPDGTFRFRTVVLLVARQNGKTTLLQIIALWRMYVDGADLVIGTAQNLDISEETWRGAVEMAEGVPDLAAEIASIDRRNGKNTLELRSGERYKIAAASRRGGRGLAGDLVLLDELREHQNWLAWAAVSKTTMARPRAQVLCASNAGDDQSVVLLHLRQQGLATLDGSGDPSLGLFEWSAPDGCAVDDRDGWVWSNPSLGWTVTEAAITSAVGTDPPEIFRTEVLCQHVDALDPVFPTGAWVSRAGAEGAPTGPVGFAVSASWPNAETGYVAVAGRRNGEMVVQVVDTRPGTSWLPARVKELSDKYRPVAVVLDDKDPAAREKAALERAGVELTAVNMTQAGQAAGMLLAAVAGDAPYLRHFSQPELDAAAAGATKRPLGDAWTWARQGPTDIGPLVAVTFAVWSVASHEQAPFFASWR